MLSWTRFFHERARRKENTDKNSPPFQVGDHIVFRPEIIENYYDDVKGYSPRQNIAAGFEITHMQWSGEWWAVDTKGLEDSNSNGWAAGLFMLKAAACPAACKCGGTGWINNFTSRQECPCGAASKQRWV